MKSSASKSSTRDEQSRLHLTEKRGICIDYWNWLHRVALKGWEMINFHHNCVTWQFRKICRRHPRNIRYFIIDSNVNLQRVTCIIPISQAAFSGRVCRGGTVISRNCSSLREQEWSRAYMRVYNIARRAERFTEARETKTPTDTQQMLTLQPHALAQWTVMLVE